MYPFHVAILVLAASAVVPALSAPLASRQNPDALVARDPAPSDEDIRDLLNHLNLRSEDIIAALSGRDGLLLNDFVLGNPIDDGTMSRVANQRTPLDSLKRDGLVHDVQNRNIFSNIGNKIGDALNTVGNGLTTAFASVGGRRAP